MAATETTTYETDVERLEQIIARLDSNEAGLRELKLDELIARLEGGAQPAE